MAFYLTSAYKPPLKVEFIKSLYDGGYASILHPDYPNGAIVVPADQLIERLELDDLL